MQDVLFNLKQADFLIDFYVTSSAVQWRKVKRQYL